MIGMLMTLLAALSLSAWSQPAPPPPASGPDMAAPQRGDHGPEWAACTAGASATAWAACTTAWAAAWAAA